jgi:hypothetical protein
MINILKFVSKHCRGETKSICGLSLKNFSKSYKLENLEELKWNSEEFEAKDMLALGGILDTSCLCAEQKKSNAMLVKTKKMMGDAWTLNNQEGKRPWEDTK